MIYIVPTGLQNRELALFLPIFRPYGTVGVRDCSFWDKKLVESKLQII
jgi:hypothetical protein